MWAIREEERERGREHDTVNGKGREEKNWREKARKCEGGKERRGS